MAGNDKRRGAVRKTERKGSSKGSGGTRRRGLEGKGPTPKAEDRVYHAKHKAKKQQERRDSGRHDPRDRAEQPELVVGRNPVIECLHANAPATALYVAVGTGNDDRLSEAVHTCAERGIAVLEVSRDELDRMTGNGMHQGIGLQVPPYKDRKSVV